MLRFIRSAAIAVILLTAMSGVVLLEESIRQQTGGPIEISGLPIPGVQIAGQWHPDFLWTGRAWRIRIQTERSLRLQLDERIYDIPSGDHTLYSNHDSTNTGQYGSAAYWGYPQHVLVSLR